jgi:cytochrome P450
MQRWHSVTEVPAERRVSRASIADTLVLLRDVVLPTLGKGPLIRRRSVVHLAERLGLDDRATESLQRMRRKYGPGPLVLRIPFRPQAILLSAADVETVLAESPVPFAADTLEKRSALRHFEPDVVLASRGEERVLRRELNQQTLETGCPMHSMVGHFAQVIAEEMDVVSAQAIESGVLDWDHFFTGWYRMVRRIVLGDAAADDAELTDLLATLRYRANFAFLRPKARKRRRQLLDRIRQYVEEATPNSLAGRMANFCRSEQQQPEHQLPQYLFAFDPGAMATFRTLAVVSVHPHAEAQVRQEVAEATGQAQPRLPFLRACLLDTLRLWPTTPAILRETTRAVAWSKGQLEPATQVIIFAPFLHRDDETLPNAHRFGPARWLDAISRPDLGFVPFSAGPVVCPAAHFVPMVSSLAMRSLLSRLRLQLAEADRLPPERLPGTLDNYTISFTVTRARNPESRSGASMSP